MALFEPVFSLFSPSNPLLVLDLFVRDPLPFEQLWKRAETMSLGSIKVRVACEESEMADLNRWEGTWEDARRRQLTAGLPATPAQRLAWLEEMISLAHQSGALPRRKKTS